MSILHSLSASAMQEWNTTHNPMQKWNIKAINWEWLSIASRGVGIKKLIKQGLI